MRAPSFPKSLLSLDWTLVRRGGGEGTGGIASGLECTMSHSFPSSHVLSKGRPFVLGFPKFIKPREVSFIKNSPFPYNIWCTNCYTLCKEWCPKDTILCEHPKMHYTTLTIPISACYYSELRNAKCFYWGKFNGLFRHCRTWMTLLGKI